MTLDILLPELLGKSPIPDASIKVYLRGSVVETDQRFAIQDVVEFMKPELKITVRWVCMATSQLNLYLLRLLVLNGFLERISVTQAVQK